MAIIAQAMRAILLASAIAATFVGHRSAGREITTIEGLDKDEQLHP